MARAQLLPYVLAIGACTFLVSTLSFVSSPATTVERSRALRALPQPGAKTEEKTQESNGGEFKMPKPDMGLMNRQARVGQSVDQDRRGNMWSVEPATRIRTDDDGGELLPAGIYFPIVIVITIGSIIVLAQVLGNDARFGGMLGDDARGINECPSPCGTRLAFLGSVKNQQVPELLAVCHEKKLAAAQGQTEGGMFKVRLVAELPVGQRPSLREPTEAKAALQQKQRQAEQAHRRIKELEQELLHVEEHVAGLEEELRKSTSQAARAAADLVSAKDQVSQLERELRLREEGDERSPPRGRKLDRCQTDGVRDLDWAKEAQLQAEAALEALKREHEEVLRARDAEHEKQRRHLESLQEQHRQLQQYCVDLRAASQEIQGFLEAAEAENVELQREVIEMKEVLEAHHLERASRGPSKQVDFQGTSLADELIDHADAEEPASFSVQKTKSVHMAEEVGEDVPSRSRRSMKPKLRRSSSSFVQAGAVADGI
ncbi:unnamed protein product [Durusdinium trenchii]|uniref:Uncharacterized protein n=1 Tax=Durusdinium trenchii TaxID=1381693 RepID=A0ABP0J1X9_9DINO